MQVGLIKLPMGRREGPWRVPLTYSRVLSYHIPMERQLPGDWEQNQETLPSIHILSQNNLATFSFLFVKFSWDRVSLCNPCCPGTHSVDQAGLKLGDLPVSAVRIKGLLYYHLTNISLIISGLFPFQVPSCLFQIPPRLKLRTLPRHCGVCL